MISLIHPSRNRPVKARATCLEWLRHADEPVEYILSLDADEPRMDEYKTLFHDTKIIVNRNRSLIDATNVGAKEATGDIMIIVSDDFECFPKWDYHVKEAVKGKTKWLLKTYDGAQSWIVTLPIFDRAFYEHNGYVYWHEYRHLFADTDMTHKADLEGLIIWRNDLTFMHNNPCYQQVSSDDINKKVMASWAQGQTIYRKRCKDKFGLKNVNIYALHPSAQPHIKWLRRLRA